MLPATAPPAAETVRPDDDVYAFGDATFHGSTGGLSLVWPVVGMAAEPDGGGYWEVALDGGVFPYGDAEFHGSTGNIALNEPIVGMAPASGGDGYWLVASDGGVFAFGDAGFFGSAGGVDPNRPIVDMAATRRGDGYWLAARDGGVFAFGGAPFHGSSADDHGADTPVIDIAGLPSGDGYWLLARDVRVCQNDLWRAEYPQGWHTNSGAVAEGSCSYFHPDEFRLQPGTEATDIAVNLRHSEAPFDRAGEGGGRCETVLSRKETVVAHRRAVIVEVRSTGACLLPEGLRSYRYVVDMGADSLIGSVVEGREPGYDRSKLVLRNIMATLAVR